MLIDQKIFNYDLLSCAYWFFFMEHSLSTRASCPQISCSWAGLSSFCLNDNQSHSFSVLPVGAAIDCHWCGRSVRSTGCWPVLCQSSLPLMVSGQWLQIYTTLQIRGGRAPLIWWYDSNHISECKYQFRLSLCSCFDSALQTECMNKQHRCTQNWIFNVLHSPRHETLTMKSDINKMEMHSGKLP